MFRQPEKSENRHSCHGNGGARCLLVLTYLTLTPLHLEIVWGYVCSYECRKGFMFCRVALSRCASCLPVCWNLHTYRLPTKCNTMQCGAVRCPMPHLQPSIRNRPPKNSVGNSYGYKKFASGYILKFVWIKPFLSVNSSLSQYPGFLLVLFDSRLYCRSFLPPPNSPTKLPLSRSRSSAPLKTLHRRTHALTFRRLASTISVWAVATRRGRSACCLA